MRCAASIALEADAPDSSSAFAEEGTAAHELASMALIANLDADAYIGRVIAVGERSYTVDDNMAGYVQVYLDHVRSLADGHDLFVEQRVSYAWFLGLPDDDGFGTSDAVIVSRCGTVLTVVDLKYGRGVAVDAAENEQLMLYALGAYREFGLVGDFETVRMVICQPRIREKPSEWECGVERLLAFGDEVRACAELAASAQATATPGEKQCRFCKAKADCPALLADVQGAIVDDFRDLTEDNIAEATANLDKVFSLSLGRKLAMVDLVEQWCLAVRSRAEGELLQGRRVDGFKLVEGRRGSRAWRDKDEAEAMLKSMRLRDDEMYDFKLISPTTAEKLAKAQKIGPRQWPKLQSLIHQPPGKPSVAPESDPRPAYSVADDFADLTGTTTPVTTGDHSVVSISAASGHPFR